MTRINEIWSESEQFLLRHREFETLKRLADIHDRWMISDEFGGIWITESDPDVHAYLVEDVRNAYNMLMDKLLKEQFNTDKVVLLRSLNWELMAIIWRSDYHDDLYDCPVGLYIGA